MRHAEHSAASWQISILAYWHISNLLTMQHYKALFTLGIPIVIGQIGVIILGFADTLMIGHHSTNELAAASFVNNMFTLAIIFATGFSYGLTLSGEPVRTGRNPCSGTDAEEQPVCQYTAGSIAHTHHVDTLSEYPPAGANPKNCCL